MKLLKFIVKFGKLAAVGASGPVGWIIHFFFGDRYLVKPENKDGEYFFGYTADTPHPWMPATGTEGRCELCGLRWDAIIHGAKRRFASRKNK